MNLAHAPQPPFLSAALSQGAVIWVYLSDIFPRACGTKPGQLYALAMNALISGSSPVVPFALLWTRESAQPARVCTPQTEKR
jgi:hypothetical protein